MASMATPFSVLMQSRTHSRLGELVFISAPFSFCFVDELLDACGLLIRQCSVFAGEVGGQGLIHRAAEEGIQHLLERMQTSTRIGLRGFMKNGRSWSQGMKSLTNCGGVASCGYRDGQDRTTASISTSQPRTELLQICGGGRGKFGGISTQS